MGNNKKPWSDKEVADLKKLYPTSTRDELLKHFKGRSWKSIEVKATNLRLKKSDSFFKSKEGGDEMKKQVVEAEEFGKQMIKMLSQRKKLVKIPNSKDLFKGEVNEKAVLVLSDIHGGKKNYFVDMTTGKAIETYNRDICQKEANNLLASIQEINYLLSGHYKIDELYIVAVGDLVDNDLIYSGQKYFIDVGVGEQILFVNKLLTDIITELLKIYKKIHFISVGGNHGRLTSRREAAPWYNNFDYLIGKMLEQTFANEKRVEVVVPESWFYMFNIYKWKYFIHHGDDVYSWMGLPYYGITRKAKARRGELNFDIEIIGHFHTSMVIPVGSSTKTLVNGCWIKDDEFAFKRYGVRSVPNQWYFGVSQKRPMTWNFNLDLQGKEGMKR